MITAGTELASRMAPVLFWDIRSPSKKLMSYTESHNDDITELKFSPFNPRLLLSGSTDELINIYDTSQSDEEEALKQVINHGSVHRAGFLSPNAVYAFSHTEHFGVYPLNAFARGEVQTLEQGEKAVEEPSPIKFGDVRGQLRCNYVAQVVEGLGGFFVGSGMPGQERFDLMPLVSEPTWRFDEKNVIRLPGAHGDEVVRDVYVDVEAQSVITCGEDGYVRTWRFSNEMIATASRVGQAEEDEEMKDTVEAKGEEQSPSKDDKKDKHERKKHRKDKGKEKKEHKPGKEEKRKKKEHRYKPY
ncbi:hypothetical protein KEM55_002275 [Ascosphaera atra]|nr:hypothetical protein KEM55_002275 [Ascosphaera atra]